VSYAGLLGHTCTIQERVEREDRLGNKRQVWVDKAKDVRCRLTNPRGGEIYTDRSQDVVKADHVLYFLEGTDIGETDRVLIVNDGHGNTLAENLDPLLVRPVSGLLGHQHHLEVPCVLFRQAA